MLTRVILVHGIATDDVMNEAQEWDIDMEHTSECWADGGYLLTLISDRELNTYETTDIIITIYNNELNIPVVPEHPDEFTPVFVGKQDNPVVLVTDRDLTFEFLGGIWGYDEEGGLYEE